MPDSAPRRPLLSLCMPTMNRQAVIAETLESIRNELTAECELVILDGSTTDATARIVERLRPSAAPLRYERRPAAGFDQDVMGAVEMSRGDYCWLFPDDDVLQPGAVAAVLRNLAHAPDCVFVNAEVRDARLEAILDSNRLGLVADRTYAPNEFENLLRDLLRGEYLSYLGCLVIRREVWAAREKAAYVGTDFLPVGVVLQAPFLRSVTVLAQPWITLRYGVGQWQNRAFAVWMLRWPTLIWSCPHLSDATKHNVVPREPWRDVKRLIIFRAMGWIDLPVYRRWIQPLPLGPYLRAVSLLLCLIPFPVVNRTIAVWAKRRWPAAKMGRWEFDHSYAVWQNARAWKPVP